MKKYVKPELFFEKYELSQHIANCVFELQSGDTKVCTADPDKGYGFDDVVGAFAPGGVCSVPMEIYCYTTGSDGLNVFMS